MLLQVVPKLEANFHPRQHPRKVPVLVQWQVPTTMMIDLLVLSERDYLQE